MLPDVEHVVTEDNDGIELKITKDDEDRDSNYVQFNTRDISGQADSSKVGSETGPGHSGTTKSEKGNELADYSSQEFTGRGPRPRTRRYTSQ